MIMKIGIGLLFVLFIYIIFLSLFQNERKYKGTHRKGVVKYECGLRQNSSEGTADDKEKLRAVKFLHSKDIKYPWEDGGTDDDQ